MSRYPKKCVVDTNVPVTANMFEDPEKIPDNLHCCVEECIKIIEHITQKGGLVLDNNDEIYNEYRKNLSLSGRKGMGNIFMKWVNDYRWTFPESDRVKITKDGDDYKEFPQHNGLLNFDNSDRKFVAVANAHSQKPPIIQATDSKWWGWKEALSEASITVRFLCPDYVRTKYKKKMRK